jgi:ArsR family transcriptional regulator
LRHAALAVEVAPLSQLFAALGDESRLRIVALLAHGELCVQHLQEALGLTQSNVSRQLAILRAAGVVTQRRQGRFIHYTLAQQDDEERKRHVKSLIASFARHAGLAEELARLTRVKKSVARP